MSPTRAVEPAEAQQMQDLDTQVEVDWMILDYLTCLAIDRALCAVQSAPDSSLEDESEWHTQTTTAFQSLVTRHRVPLPEDLDLKLRILTLTNHLRCCVPARPDRDHTPPVGLPRFGLEFMDLCSSATSKVSETRWFDVGARIFTLAILEERAKGIPPSQDLNRLFSWTSNDLAHQAKWEKVRSEYLDKLPLNRTMETQFLDSGLLELKETIIYFLVDLMNTLDQPILVQLERGKLGNLSAIETQRLMDRVGFP